MRRIGRDTRGALLVVVGALIILSIPALRERMGGSAGVIAAPSRHLLPDLALSQVGGGRWRLGQYRGKVVAINLWATWCAPCREETPVIVRAVRDFGPRGFAAVGVSLDEGDREGKVRAFARQFGAGYPMAFPDAMSQMSAGLEGIPTTLLIDRKGRLAKTYVGEVNERVLRSDVEALLRE